jgi:hypothetical protein
VSTRKPEFSRVEAKIPQIGFKVGNPGTCKMRPACIDTHTHIHTYVHRVHIYTQTHTEHTHIYTYTHTRTHTHREFSQFNTSTCNACCTHDGRHRSTDGFEYVYVRIHAIISPGSYIMRGSKANRCQRGRCVHRVQCTVASHGASNGCER